jgi:tetraacyldisaccharide 4'-kinase
LLIFPDHHEFSSVDIQKIQQTFNIIANPNKIIVTTEKDAMRMKNPDIEGSMHDLPVFFLPIEIQFHHNEKVFNQIITDYVRKNQTDKAIHT